jgi:diadenosine tetraphosphate (Ap4A) HIT family hydrolase
MTINKCPLCELATSPNLIWENSICRVIAAKEAGLPGFIRVVLKEHVAEMTDLDSATRNQLMDVVYQVESHIREVMKPKKVNLAALGNMVPHIHWHVIPRYEDDNYFPGSVWSNSQRELSENLIKGRLEQEQQLIKKLRDQLK